MRAVRLRRRGDGGWSAVETMVAIGLVAISLLVLVEQMSIGFRESSSSEHRAFAAQKAAALLGEVQNSIAMGRISKGAELLALSDAAENVVLTTRLDDENLPFQPDHPMSDNQLRQGHWQWSRKLTITPHNLPGMFYCGVEIRRWGDGQRWETEAVQRQLFSLLPEADAPEQGFDVYVLACGEAMSLDGDLAELRSQLETAAATLRQQSQASVKLHWIRSLGYGRDPCYAPYVNTSQPADTAAPWAYWLPGVLGGSGTGQTLYHHELLPGLHRTEWGLVGGQSTDDPLPVAIADQHNHCMRTPAARALFDQRVAAGLEDDSAPPLQLLLEDMNSRPERYRNAVLVNLHGQALPMPPLRNYADAAREPQNLPGVRVVTHPARLQTPRDPDGDGANADTDPLELRVYAWRTEGSLDVLTQPILVQIYGGDLSQKINTGAASLLTLHRLAGGIDPDTGHAGGSNCGYVGFDEPGGDAPKIGERPYSMHYQAGFVSGSNPYTWLQLYNTPLCAPPVDSRGLQADARLYGCDYSPGAIDGTFTQDLAHDCAGLEMRNTARWRLRIQRRALGVALPNADQAVRIVTRIGSDTGTGMRWPTPCQPLNRSETWAWWSRSATAVPITERCQFLGDPRLCPYADLTATGAGLRHGYNWHFDDLQAAVDARPLWPCLDAVRLQDGFGAGCRADAPRFLALLRQDLQKCGAVLVAPLGASASTLLLGGEIGCSPTGTVAPVALHPDWTGGATTAVDTVTPGATTGTRVLRRGAGGSWWAKPWLGELFPDDQWQSWFDNGNLAITPGPAALQWQLLHTATLPDLPYGLDFTVPAGAMLGDAGTVMLVDHGTLASTYLNPPAGPVTASPTAAQTGINAATNLVPPATVHAGRIVATDRGFPGSLPAFAFTDTYPRSVATLREPLWSSTIGHVGAIVDFAAAPDARAFLVPWTISDGGCGVRELAEQTLLSGLRALHVGGTPGLAGRIPQTPRLQVLEPAAGATLSAPEITVRWQTTWRRFDDQPYTNAYPEAFAESESDLVYRILWSHDDGVTWTSALTGQPTRAGVWPPPDDSLADTGNGAESYAIDIAALADGEYTLLVEAWRTSTHCHRAFHRVHVAIHRGFLLSERE